MQTLFYPAITWENFCKNQEYHVSRLAPGYSGQLAYIPIMEDAKYENLLCVLANDNGYRAYKSSDDKIYDAWQMIYSSSDGEIYEKPTMPDLRKGILEMQAKLKLDQYVGAGVFWDRVDFGIQMRRKAMFLVFHPKYEFTAPDTGVIMRTVVDVDNSFAIEEIDIR